MLLAALSSQRRVSASPRSFNSQIGVALSLLQLDPAAEVAILECGMSQPGEIARLQPLVRPDCGILTNVGDAHIAAFGSRSAIAHEKAQLFAGLAESGWVLTPAGEVLGRGALERGVDARREQRHVTFAGAQTLCDGAWQLCVV
jgi:UDP-N-acetylmuramyl pentapeptide synthase